MNLRLNESIANYFDLSNGEGTASVEDCFTPNATVHDEGGTYQGLSAIESWLQETRQKYQFNSQPVAHSRPLAAPGKDQQEQVVVEVSGNFPGSPIQLNYVFVLADGKIESLEIS